MSRPGPVHVPGVGPALGPVALGANHLGSALDRDASFALLDAHVEHGGTLVDTALVYADWLPDVERACSERTIGRWLASRGVDGSVVVGTKGGHPDLREPARPRLDPASLRHDLERSLDHLGLPRLPLWWLHRDDPRVPAGEIVDAVESFRAEGLLTAWGVANWRADRLGQARAAASARGADGPVAASVGYALAPPAPGVLAPDLVTLDPALLELHRSTQLPLVAYSAQAKGWFDKVATGTEAGLASLYDHGTARTTAAEVAAIARRHGLTPTELALAGTWMLPFPTVAVVGPRTVAQLDSCYRAAHVALDPDDEASLRRLGLQAVAP